VAAALLLTHCKKSGDLPPAAQAATETELRVAGEVGAGWFGESQIEKAHEALEGVANDPSATPQDLVNLACVKLQRFRERPEKAAIEVERARQLCQTAVSRDPKCAAAHYVLGMMALDRDFKPVEARDRFAKVVELAPDDLPTRIRYSDALQETGDLDAAIAQIEVVHQRGEVYAGSYYPVAVYRLSRLLRQRKRGDDLVKSAALQKEHDRLRDAGNKGAPDDEVRLGKLARVQVAPPPPRPGDAPKTAPAVRFERAGAPLLGEAGTIAALAAGDVNGDGCDDLLAVGNHGLWCALRLDSGEYSVREVKGTSGSTRGTKIGLFDFENRGSASAVVFGPDGGRLLSPDPAGVFRDESGQLPPLLGVNDLQGVDFDHEGHLDLLLATSQGVRLLRNDGVPTSQEDLAPTGPIRWSDVTAATAMPAAPCEWATIEDFDADHDIDFLVGGAATPPLVISNLRNSRFEILVPERSGLVASLHGKPQLLDLDHDGRVDVVEPGAPPAWQRNRGDGTFEPPRPLPDLAGVWDAARAGQATLADLDWNGEQDLVGLDAAGEVKVRFGSLTAAGAAELALGGRPVAGAAPLLDDFDDDGAFDLAIATEKGIELRRGRVDGGHALTLLLDGEKDNRSGIGSLVEVRVGDRYERGLARSRRELFGLGTAPAADVARITWPDGVVQSVVHPANSVGASTCGTTERATTVALVHEKAGLIESCPFLYAFDGRHYGFVSDVIGSTPLGLPIAAGVYVPPDHRDLDRIASDQLRAVDDEYRLQFTEELREVTYLDRAQLWVVDHPAGVEIQPELRFTFPPFPPLRFDTIRDPLPLVKAVDQEGRDWTRQLAAIDDDHAVPFRICDPRYLGLTSSHFLELTLPDAVRTAKRVRLVMTGWIYWTDASVNMGAAQSGTLQFVPPTVSVPDGHGEWRECSPPIGFPAGKTRTMVVDVTSMLCRDDPRLRLSSTIRLYWDAIRVAVDEGDEPVTVTKLDPKSAQLWYRGFSSPVADVRGDHPARFDWDSLEEQPRWDQQHGMLTRYGDVLPLLTEADDCFVILSSGDAIDLRFDAATTPPKEGMGRTYLLLLDGWAKDADPNTMFSQSVEPLPFHDMSGYPYRADEHYPDDELHEQYLARWNTRPGRDLIESLAVPAAAITRR
jgi:hypothetical protein